MRAYRKCIQPLVDESINHTRAAYSITSSLLYSHLYRIKINQSNIRTHYNILILIKKKLVKWLQEMKKWKRYLWNLENIAMQGSNISNTFQWKLKDGQLSLACYKVTHFQNFEQSKYNIPCPVKRAPDISVPTFVRYLLT